MKPSLTTLTPSQKRHLCAESCGWTYDKVCYCWRHKDCKERFSDCPDYCNNLNAMHEAEATLTDLEHLRFRESLYKIIEDAHAGDTSNATLRAHYSATPSQRLDAYLLAKGLAV